MKKRFSLLLAVIVTASALFAALPVSAKVQVEDFCYQYTPQMTEDTFRYLDEFYTQNHPEEALLWTYGLEEDKRILTEETKRITKDCESDKAKVAAIYAWITEHVTYDEENSSTYSFDVLYDCVGNCIGQAMLMRDMCRVAGVPAVWGDGFVGNMETWTVGEMQSAWTGHAWCFVYTDGEWALYDTVFGVEGETDQGKIAKSYFLDEVEGVVPLYHDELPPFRDPDGCIAYRDGKSWIYKQDGPEPVDSDLQGCGSLINTQLTIDCVRYVSQDGTNYLDDISKKDSMVVGELYHDGWFSHGYATEKDGVMTYDLNEFIHYAYQNGTLATATVMEYDGQKYYMDQGNARRLCVDEKDIRIHAGKLFVQTGYQGKIFEFCNFEKLKNDPNTEIIWIAHNPEIATMDDNFVITSYQEGCAMFEYEIHFTRIVELEQAVLDNPEMMEQIRQECEMAGDELVDGKIVSKGVGGFGYLFYYFMDDLTRPTAYKDAGSADKDNSSTVTVQKGTLDSRLESDILQEMQETGFLTLSVANGYNAFSFGATLLRQAAKNEVAAGIYFEQVSLCFDPAAIQSLFEKERSGHFVAECLSLSFENLSESQQKALSKESVCTVLSLALKNGGEHFHSFGNGTVTISFPFQEESGYQKEDYTVFYLSETGEMEEMPTSFIGDYITFETNHFSAFVLVNTAVTPQSGNLLWILVGVGAVLLIGSGITVLLLAKKAKSKVAVQTEE